MKAVSVLLSLLLAWIAAALPPQRAALDKEQAAALYKAFPPFPALDPHFPPGGSTPALLSPILIPRTPGSENASLVRQHFVDHFAALGDSWTLLRDEFTAPVPEYGGLSGTLNFTNLIFRLNPPGYDADDISAKYLTLVAHYDSKIAPHGFIGATDSAVPCAILMYIAQALTAATRRRWADDPWAAQSDLALQIIFMDGEEALVEWSAKDSLYGARHLAERWEAETRAYPYGRLSEIQNIDLFVLLDLLGAEAPTVPCFFGMTAWACRQLSDTESMLRSAGIAASNKNTDANSKKQKNYINPTNLMTNAFVDDDHMPFLKRGTPVLHIIPVPFPLSWHTILDNGDNLSLDAIHDWSIFLATWVAGYLGLAEYIE
ncbi:peptidase family M28-domain-containing protein [Myxozyma melibiosi]|uniref:Peptide hydrolase n=1 Tax=Myxozyma melibiosi TaxID=54550 RepID=A0ABR1EZT4_9ASCO